MIDIGVNFTNPRFDKDRELVIKRAQGVGVKALLVTGTNVAESRDALALCQQFPDYLACTAGVHPHDADNVTPDYLFELKSLAQSPHVKAIGECGLDFNRNFSTPDNQQTVFAQQLALACELQLPLFLHQRDAFEPWLEMLLPYVNQVPAMISHCFTGDLAQLNACLAQDIYIGITGWLCDERRGQELRTIVKHIPLERLMIETDAPYLTPRTIRPKPKSSRNEPSFLPYIVQTLAQQTGYAADDIMKYSMENSAKVFGMDKLCK